MKPLWIAFSTLTLLPFGVKNPSTVELRRSVAFYPAVGIALGWILELIHRLSFSTDLKALVILLFWVGFTGALHLDGLGDCLDGWWGADDPCERQRIMKSPDLGTYGVVGIGLTLLAKYVLLNHLLVVNDGSFWTIRRCGLWLVAIPAAARWAASVACFISKTPSGNEGLGSQVMGISTTLLGLSTLIALAGCMALKEQGFFILVLAAGVAWGVSFYSREMIGGLTGDGMGAIIEITEVSALLGACLLHG